MQPENLWTAMEAAGWVYDRRANVYRKGDAVVSYAQAEQAYRDALAGVERSAAANENEEAGDAA